MRSVRLTTFRRPSRWVRLVVCSALLVGVWGTVLVGPAAADDPSVRPQPGCTAGESQPGRQVVLLVHGFVSNQDTWGSANRDASPPTFDEASFMAKLQAEESDVSFAWFDYHEFATEWVTHREIGPALATCLSDIYHDIDRLNAAAYGISARPKFDRIAVVAHSMGGLAMRCALSPDCNGGDGAVASRVGEVITFGTPNAGSFLRGPSLMSAAETAVGDIVDAACTARLGPALAGKLFSRGPAPDWCLKLQDFANSPAAQAFQAHSEQLQSLPSFPDGMPVMAVAGDMKVNPFDVRFFDLGFAVSVKPSLGDGVVLVPSALWGGTPSLELGGVEKVDCGNAPFDVTCTHVSVTKNDRFVETAAQELARYLESEYATDSWPTPSGDGDPGGGTGGVEPTRIREPSGPVVQLREGYQWPFSVQGISAEASGEIGGEPAPANMKWVLMVLRVTNLQSGRGMPGPPAEFYFQFQWKDPDCETIWDDRWACSDATTQQWTDYMPLDQIWSEPSDTGSAVIPAGEGYNVVIGTQIPKEEPVSQLRLSIGPNPLMFRDQRATLRLKGLPRGSW